MGLVVSRNIGERIAIGPEENPNQTIVTVIGVDQARVRLHVEAPREIKINKLVGQTPQPEVFKKEPVNVSSLESDRGK